MSNAIVIGGGIGGLSAACGLREAGWTVTVVERATELTAIGAGITLWPNALRALDVLGLGNRLRPLLTARASGALHDIRGRELTRFDPDAFERRFGKPLIGIHRAQLTGLLREALPRECLRLGTEVTSITSEGEVGFADGGQQQADLIVAADGIGSRARAYLWPAHAATVHAGFTAFRAVAETAGEAPHGITWGPGTEFGVVPLTDGRQYWYASLTAEPDVPVPNAKAHLQHWLHTWPSGIRDLVERTPGEAILHHDLRVLRRPLPCYVSGRVALLGDAAHAMTPFLGQGGCQAIEDAVVLAAALARHSSVDGALRHYDAERRPRAQKLVKASALAGAVGNRPHHRLFLAARNTVLRALPESTSTWRMAFAADWTPPEITIT